MIRFLDFSFSLLGLLILLPLLVVIFILSLFFTSRPIFCQTRVGLDKRLFTIYKFRTMPLGTANLPTHLISSSKITPFFTFLRKSKLDELPQLFNVLRGDMSLVGPRPCMPSQTELISLRDKMGVYSFRPGITGLSQIREIDMSTPSQLAETDSLMLMNFNLKSYFKYVFLTVLGKGSGDRTS